MHVLRTSFNGNPNVGLYGHCTGKYLLVGSDVPKKLHHDLSKVFKAEVKEVTIAGSGLIGCFLAGNKNATLVPAIAYDDEVEKLKKLGIPIKVIPTKLTCFGNNILVNDRFALISPEYTEAEAKMIGKALEVPVIQGKLVDTGTVGSVAVMNRHGCLVHYEAKEADIALIKSRFKVAVEHGSCNLGNPYVKSGIIVSDQGFIMGGLSGGPEIVHADRTFGFIDK